MGLLDLDVLKATSRSGGLALGLVGVGLGLGVLVGRATRSSCSSSQYETTPQRVGDVTSAEEACRGEPLSRKESDDPPGAAPRHQVAFASTEDSARTSNADEEVQVGGDPSDNATTQWRASLQTTHEELRKKGLGLEPSDADTPFPGRSNASCGVSITALLALKGRNSDNSEISEAVTTVLQYLSKTSEKFDDDPAPPPPPPRKRSSLALGDDFYLSSAWKATDVSDRAKIVESLSGWNFNAWMFDEKQLMTLIEEMFNHLGLFEEFDISVKNFRHFLVLLSRKYKPNPYHNFRHAFDVTQTVFALIVTNGAEKYLTKFDMLSVLVAAMCHDVDHPGLSNNFQINACTPLALTYNDISILENHHCSEAFKILGNEECNIFSGLEQSDYHEVRRTIIACILSTDMTFHFELRAKLKTTIDQGKAKIESEGRPPGSAPCVPGMAWYDIDAGEHRRLLMKAMLHAADLSNLVKPFDVAKKWAYAVVDEFFTQGDLEKELHLPISPYMDRDTVVVEQMEINFIDYIVGPLYCALTEMLPSLEDQCTILAENRAAWQLMLNERMDDVQSNGGTPGRGSCTG